MFLPNEKSHSLILKKIRKKLFWHPDIYMPPSNMDLGDGGPALIPQKFGGFIGTSWTKAGLPSHCRAMTPAPDGAEAGADALCCL